MPEENQFRDKPVERVDLTGIAEHYDLELDEAMEVAGEHEMMEKVMDDSNPSSLFTRVAAMAGWDKASEDEQFLRDLIDKENLDQAAQMAYQLGENKEERKEFLNQFAALQSAKIQGSGYEDVLTLPADLETGDEIPYAEFLGASAAEGVTSGTAVYVAENVRETGTPITELSQEDLEQASLEYHRDHLGRDEEVAEDIASYEGTALSRAVQDLENFDYMEE